MITDIRALLSIMRDLRSDDGENAEYDRALRDVTANVLDVDDETAAAVLGMDSP